MQLAYGAQALSPNTSRLGPQTPGIHQAARALPSPSGELCVLAQSLSVSPGARSPPRALAAPTCLRGYTRYLASIS